LRAARHWESIIAILLLFLAGANSIACAGDAASREVIGFSPDGRSFAFEQYGIEDGSGFPYSEIVVIDAESDQWVKGTPIRRRIDDERAPLARVRQEARAEAAAILSKLKISEPGHHLASNPAAEWNPIGSVTVNIAAAAVPLPPDDDLITFYPAEKPLKSAECSKYSDAEMKGVTLTMVKGPLVREAKEAQWPAHVITLHEDKDLPASRGCALGYSIADVFSHRSAGRVTYAVLLHVRTTGFEGPNSRFLAVTHICRTADCDLRKFK
jgi:predicted secreted protein